MGNWGWMSNSPKKAIKNKGNKKAITWPSNSQQKSGSESSHFFVGLVI
jgi:hypothetical protein